MREIKLYIIPGSRHSEEAQKALREAGLLHRTIVLNTRDLLAAATFDLGIQKAPALYVGGKYYQGLKSIMDFIQRNNK